MAVNKNLAEGRIIRGIAGFYYIETEDGRIYACKPKGKLRRDDIKPLPGDQAAFVVTHEQDREGCLVSIKERRNSLIRPSVANVDQALLFFAARDPLPSLSLIDRYLVVLKDMCLPAALAFNKADIALDGEIDELTRVYGNAGITVFALSVKTGFCVDEIGTFLKDRVTVLAGPSGTGKSSLINRLCPSADMEIGELSRKISRGKNTTRRSELFRVGETGTGSDTWLVDTPGFTALKLPDISVERLSFLYPEFRDHTEQCRFSSCRHAEDAGCAVKSAVSEGEIPVSRYESYLQFLNELNERENRRYK